MTNPLEHSNLASKNSIWQNMLYIAFYTTLIEIIRQGNLRRNFIQSISKFMYLELNFHITDFYVKHYYSQKFNI